MAENWAPKTIFTGDNLLVMRGMNTASVDLIYLDPPFNSNADYAAPIGSKAAGAEFKDTWTLSDVDAEWINLMEDRHPALWRVLLAAQRNSDKSYLAYMAVRLLEMHRLLRPAGSLYLHCDPTMSHHLKLVLDAIFGPGSVRDEIVWRRSDSGMRGSQHAAKSWGSTADRILFVARSAATVVSPEIPLTDPADIAAKFPKIDENGDRYNTKTTPWCSPSMGARPNLCYEFLGFTPPYASGWRLSRERMEEEHAKGNIVVNGDTIERRSYARDYRGASPGEVWTDVVLGARSKERTGYPTQKPLALLDRIIRASAPPRRRRLRPLRRVRDDPRRSRRPRPALGRHRHQRESRRPRRAPHRGTPRPIPRHHPPDRAAAAHRPRTARRAAHAQADPLRPASGRLCGLSNTLRDPPPRSRPHHRRRQRGNRPSRQPPTPLRPLQPRQRRPRHGIPTRQTPDRGVTASVPPQSPRQVKRIIPQPRVSDSTWQPIAS